MGSFNYHWKTLRVYEIRKKNDLAILFDGENLKVYEPEDNNAVAYLLEDLGSGGAFRHNFYYGGSPALQIDSEIKVGKVLRPLSNNAIDLGSENYKFRHGYFGGNIKVNDILPVNDYIIIGGGQQNFIFPSIYGNPIAYKEPYKVEQYDPSTGNWNDITGNYTWKFITDMRTGTYVNSGVKSPDGSETDWRIRLYYDLGATWMYIHGILLTLQHTQYVKEVVIEASDVSDFSSNVVTLLNLSNIKAYVWDGAFFARTSTPNIGGRRYIRITLTLSTTVTTITIKIWEIMLLNLAPSGVFFDTLLPFDWDSDRNIKLYGNLTPNDNNKYDIGNASYKFRNLHIAGFGDLGSLRINGTEVIDSSRNLKNVSASRSIITDFFASPFWDNIPDKPSQFPPEPHTHLRNEISDFWNTPFWSQIPDKPHLFEVISDLTVETNVDYVEWTGLDINRHGVYIIFVTIKNPQSQMPFYEIFIEGYNDPSLYYREWIQAVGGSLSSGTNKDACICRAGYNESTMCIAFIMRDVDGYLRAYSLETRRRGSNVNNLTHAIVSTFTITNITTIRIQSTVAGAIGAGSRFILARVKSA